MADGKPGRRPDSVELKAAKMRLRAASSNEARIASQAEVDAIVTREKAARAVAAQDPTPACSEDELFALLVECEPKIREAEQAKKQAAEREKQEREVLARAFGSMSAARKRLELFRRAQTAEGEAEARELIEMRQRLAAHQDGRPEPAPAASDIHAAA